MRKETTEQLDAFREQQRQAESSATQQDADPALEGGESWVTGPRKRKKGRESGIGGMKLRRVSTTEKQATGSGDAEAAGKGKPEEPSTTKSEEGVVRAPPGASVTQTAQDASEKSAAPIDSAASRKAEATPTTDKPTTTQSPPTVGLGLGAYSSDEDEGD